MKLPAQFYKPPLIVGIACIVIGIVTSSLLPDKIYTPGANSEGLGYTTDKESEDTKPSPPSPRNIAQPSSSPNPRAETAGSAWRSDLTQEMNQRHQQNIGDLLRWAESFESINQYIFLIRKIAANARPEDCPELLDWYQSKVSSGKIEAEVASAIGAVLGNRGNLSDGKIPDLCESKYFGESFFKGLVSRNSPLLSEKLALIPSSEKRDSFAAATSRALADNIDFAEALRVAEIIEGSSEKSESLSNIAFEMARKNPSEALKWFNSAPEMNGETQARCAAGIARAWFYDDSLEASKWVESLPEGMPRDQASSAIALSLCRTSPEDSLAWASTIRNEKTRQYTLGEIEKYLK